MLKTFNNKNNLVQLITRCVQPQLGRHHYSTNTGDENNKPKTKTAILMLNLGGPQTLNDVEPFLTRLFTDRDIIKLPFQETVGRLIAKRRSPAVQKLYQSIGGGSPIGKWTEIQGKALSQRLDQLSPQSAPHKCYIGFRYASPLVDDAIQQMTKDGVTRAVAFSQYPQFSCTTTGSSLNNLWKSLETKGLESKFDWSIIDRWPLHEGFVSTVASKIQQALTHFANEAKRLNLIGEAAQPVLLFSAHSLPMRTVERGDPYPTEVAATVSAVVQTLGDQVPQHILCWQSKVGPLPWLVPKTSDTVVRLAKAGRNVIIVPIAFTSDHIETLSEIDIELKHLAHENGMKVFMRSESLNDDPKIIDAMADIVHRHISSGEQVANIKQYSLKCPGCIDETGTYCRTIRNPVSCHATA
ncbi:hypothetical protein SAMD00019534_104720 [Acytostelium subglobosum LB1]|uniref:hypothetical protein n=1 Tax=Acytostelium subglobosum LB1 TaxID=1410327 RepID=UPI0006449629|nr:hypothetical protein SAMD00019534_104720 [Acytostelium subglobosum LB1]GAM27297.1 hypothetical protein SAMD00019534_104720 [Acytostelium subglobosum LB1]|eukprot:XP_012749764.1 hypothetical protein SAMD00019534_104720 [Acytostelium subglobosum LB1]